MTTLEIVAPTNQSFTASLYEKGSDTEIEVLSLAENANAKGIYTGTVTSVLSGYYKVIVYDGSIPIVVTDAYFNGSDTVFASDVSLSTLEESQSLSSIQTSVTAIYDRIVYSVPDDPIYPIPAPSSSNVTRVYSYCYDVHGRPVAGVPITIKMLDVSNSANKGSYLSDEFTFSSDAYGVASTEIPRGTTFRYRIRSGSQSQWIEFKGVDAETYQLPFLINK